APDMVRSSVEGVFWRPRTLRRNGGVNASEIRDPLHRRGHPPGRCWRLAISLWTPHGFTPGFAPDFPGRFGFALGSFDRGGTQGKRRATKAGVSIAAPPDPDRQIDPDRETSERRVPGLLGNARYSVRRHAGPPSQTVAGSSRADTEVLRAKPGPGLDE